MSLGSTYKPYIDVTTSIWKSYTPSISATVSPTIDPSATHNAIYVKNGNILRLSYFFYGGEVTDGIMGVGDYHFSLPHGEVINTANIEFATNPTTNSIRGTCLGAGQLTNRPDGGDIGVYVASSTQLILSGSTSVGNNFISATWMGVQKGLNLSFVADIPIL